MQHAPATFDKFRFLAYDNSLGSTCDPAWTSSATISVQLASPPLPPSHLGKVEQAVRCTAYDSGVSPAGFVTVNVSTAPACSSARTRKGRPTLIAANSGLPLLTSTSG
ncbi:hypothetical protein PLESTB_001625300 [Pleodorina starrii]|uniref:Uncharacterized protein n=1 Tax=Pleodorina starrii TaxID=330485 RepID=A0A9W6BZ61_9CHLO|nr:hypothetical protein PLESTM_001809100 [Pleodorina starrii]GLC60545.1 hypothetical protein PLESTB_001625300 [Pleodorina starrii]GLC76643.1 hypothetical protein PLESTF_001809000 [Pleodorina starrii]